MTKDALLSLRNLLSSKIASSSSGTDDIEQTNAQLSETLAALDILLNQQASQPQTDSVRLQKSAQLILGDLDALAARNILGDTPSEIQVLTQAQAVLAPVLQSKISQDLPKYTIVAPPPPSRHPNLDPEVADSLSSLAFLHVLVVNPRKILPSGKSLRSALASPQVIKALGGDPKSMGISVEQGKQEKRKSLQDAITEITHRAFWDEALEALSSPLPSTQLARLRRLYQDLYAALNGSSPPLLPPSHLILATLSDPPSPTSAPLSSAILHLRELAAALRERCAPVRDAALDRMIATLSDIPQSSTDAASSSQERLAHVVVDSTRTLLELIAQMQSDLKAFMLASIPDSELRTTLQETAREGEREAVINLYGGEESVKMRWAKSIEDGGDRWTWIQRLVDALGSSVPVACPQPILYFTGSQGQNSPNTEASGHESKHILPPPFLFSIPELVRTQNYIQALVIAAALRTLIPRASQPPPSSTIVEATAINATESQTFTERILALLTQEIESSNADNDANSEATKLVNLADEVIRERRRISDLASRASSEQLPASSSSTAIEAPTLYPSESSAETDRMQMAVSALLRADSGVFKLLRARLLASLLNVIITCLTPPTPPSVPETLRTGTTVERPGKRPRLASPLRVDVHCVDEIEEKIKVGEVKAKGFEDDAALQNALKELVRDLVREIKWVSEVWGEMLKL